MKKMEILLLQVLRCNLYSEITRDMEEEEGGSRFSVE
jgi:hypothetical protein